MHSPKEQCLILYPDEYSSDSASAGSDGEECYTDVHRRHHMVRALLTYVILEFLPNSMTTSRHLSLSSSEHPGSKLVFVPLITAFIVRGFTAFIPVVGHAQIYILPHYHI